MRVSLNELARRLGGKLSDSQMAENFVTGFALDTRQVRSGDLFLAIRGSRVDGHSFVDQAISGGAMAALVERPVQAPYILVENLVEALAQMALSYREEFRAPVIGITGSAGKTTTKEFLAAACQSLGPILKTEGNRNTEYTAPLVWAEGNREARVAIIEMAMRGFDQISHLASFSRPEIGIITNIGFSHIEMVGSREGIARAKGELLTGLPDDGTAIIWSEDEYLGHLIALAGDRTVKTFGFSGNATCHIQSYKPIDWTHGEVVGILNDRTWRAVMPTVGRHLALNVAASVLAASEVGVTPEVAAEGISSAVLPPMRMEVKEVGGVTIVLDNYNASPPAMIAAIETLDEIPCKGRRVVILGTMRELGDETLDSHREVGRSLGRSKVDYALLFGEHTEWIAEAAIKKGFDASKLVMAESLAAMKKFIHSLQPGDTLLIKGSRALELERALEGMN